MYNPKVFSEAGLVRVLAEATTIAKNVRTFHLTHSLTPPPPPPPHSCVSLVPGQPV